MHPDILQAQRIIESLPQRKFIQDDDIARWLNDVWETEPDRIIWHANRLRGWGGSEIGILVADMRSKEGSEFSPTYHTFKSAHELVKEKLLISSPSRDEDENINDLKRGTECESWLIDKLVRDLKETYGEDQVKIDQATMDALAGMVVNEKHPWLVGNIDLALIIKNKRLLIDIKAPQSSKAYYMSVSTPFTYDCQLKQYELVASQLPVPIEFDNTVLACYDHDKYKFHLGVVNSDESIKEDILRAGDLYFNEYLLKGRVPDFPKSKVPSATMDVLPDSVEGKLSKAHALKIAIKAAEKQLQDVEDEINAEITSMKLPPNPKLSFAGGLGNIKGKTKCHYDDEILTRFASRYDIHIDADEGLTDKTRQDIHEQMVKDESVSDNTVILATNPEYSFTYPLSRAKKGATKLAIDELADDAHHEIGNLVNSMAERIVNGNDKPLINEEHKKRVSHSEKSLVNKDGALVVEEKSSLPKHVKTEEAVQSTQPEDNINTENKAQLEESVNSIESSDPNQDGQYDDSYERDFFMI